MGNPPSSVVGNDQTNGGLAVAANCRSLTKETAPRFELFAGAKDRTRRNAEDQHDRSLSSWRSAGSESQPRRIGERSGGVEGMLDPLEIRGHRQLRRCRRERA